MNYILLDNFNDTINIVCMDDDSGEPLIFDAHPTQEQIDELCQNGIVVPLDTPVYTQEQVINILVSWQQTLSPEAFETSKGLDTIDFLDAPTRTAQQLCIEKEFEKALLEANFKENINTGEE
jgi:hypothetical protein